MAVTRGGKKRSYKKVGRLSARKCYQKHCRHQLQAGMIPTSSGNWGNDNILHEKIANVYRTQRRG